MSELVGKEWRDLLQGDPYTVPGLTRSLLAAHCKELREVGELIRSCHSLDGWKTESGCWRCSNRLKEVLSKTPQDYEVGE